MLKTVFAIAVVATVASATVPADAQTRARGKAATCLVDDPEKVPCTFIPKNGDGSFSIITKWGTFHATKVGPDTMDFLFENGREVEQGLFTRSRDDRACWIQKEDARRICVW
jgi:hypothetical protein